MKKTFSGDTVESPVLLSLLVEVGVPRRWLMDRVTVNCGHCNHLSFLTPGDVVRCICPTSHLQMSLQGPCFGSRREPPSPRRSSTSVPKKHRAPSAYNHFMREEIQRIKAAKPDIPHREAFSMAAKNWANYDPRNSSDV
ncbi:hypothetical protein OPV22_029515 [Ensete ventricosum]|uniref:YABBY protein C-terminal domain-containing protein n=1 Tax=Ensete ventricosum TaxID=4639 RepID=A0AAV8Q9F5_ENSVE|nr:hypothetical protein OPV22_029515 [Ensete ventricosum]